MIRKNTICLLTVILFSLCAMLPAEPAAEQQEKTIRTEQAGAKEDSLLDTLGIDVHDKTIQEDEIKAFRTLFQSVTHLVSEGTRQNHQLAGI